ncbi:MAG: hypothetical protein LBU60_05155 [Clostridiales bacterium]|jgi:hypothetical protein|nr:hypothetical protein [Clostridiales bacterium]
MTTRQQRYVESDIAKNYDKTFLAEWLKNSGWYEDVFSCEECAEQWCIQFDLDDESDFNDADRDKNILSVCSECEQQCKNSLKKSKKGGDK